MTTKLPRVMPDSARTPQMPEHLGLIACFPIRQKGLTFRKPFPLTKIYKSKKIAYSQCQGSAKVP